MWRLRGFRNWELLFQQYAYADFQRTLRGTVPPKDATPMALKRDPSQNIMSTIHYFAYGSNMSTPRLRYRVPGCRFEFVARLPNYKLSFHKRSNDGSVKCNAFKTVQPTDAVIGCVYEIPSNQKPALDRAEGLGSGYHEEIVHVLSPKGGEVVVCTYIADASFIDDSLQPYSWYKNFVLAGAEEHRLPAEYVESRIGAVHAIRDPDPQREQARRAEIKNAACGFPALRSPVCFTPRFMGPILPERLSAMRAVPDSH